MPGPVPKRTAERRRTNSPSSDTVRMEGTVEVPDPDPTWHPIALRWYEALRDSGQAKHYEPSDWAAAHFVAEGMTRNLKSGKFSAQLFASVWSAMTDLLTTEGARRRARMEVERNASAPLAPVDDLDAYRGLGG